MPIARVQKSVGTLFVITLLAASVGFAETAPTSGNPQTNASDRNYDTNQPNSVPGGLQKAEDGGNRALNHVDAGVHKGIRKTKHAGHKAKAKTKEAASDLSEPAVKPQ